ncbi:MAG: hypothetical protein QGF55_06215, partial [SAR324 cluster bacterium]|nr:hypothetical protein [SAR324 cluster bacterium]
YLAKNRNRYNLKLLTIPAQHGEKMVLRLLNQVPVTHNFKALGFFRRTCASSNKPAVPQAEW